MMSPRCQDYPWNRKKEIKVEDFDAVIQNPSVAPFLRGDQVWHKGSQCTIIEVDMDGDPPSCVVEVNSTGTYVDTELALLHPCKFEIHNYILRPMCPTSEKIGVIQYINKSKQTMDYIVYNTGEMIRNVSFHKIVKGTIPKSVRRDLEMHSCVYKEFEVVLWYDEKSMIIHLNNCKKPPTVIIKVLSSGLLMYTDVQTIRKLPQRVMQN